MTSICPFILLSKEHVFMSKTEKRPNAAKIFALQKAEIFLQNIISSRTILAFF